MERAGNVSEASAEAFIEWYVQNMFSMVAQHTMSETQSGAYSLAKHFDVSVTVIDKMRKEFDKYDADGSGEIDLEEFQGMLETLLNCRNRDDLSKERVYRFWKEIDIDSSGGVTFDEFCGW